MAEMDTPESILREKREAKKLTLQEVAKETNINERYLKALEEGNPDVFPGEVYFKGFLRNYANFLGLDSQELISHYEESGLMEQPLEFIKPKIDVVTLLEKRRFDPFGQMRSRIMSAIEWLVRTRRIRSLYLILIILLSFFLIWWFFSYEGEEISRMNQQERAGLTGEVAPLEKKGLLLEIEATDEVWLRVARDKQDQTREVLLRPGEHLGLEAEEQITIKAGNAGGLVLKLNGRQLPPLGRRGEVVTKTITARGIEQIDEFSQ